jgi:hypothetical protein
MYFFTGEAGKKMIRLVSRRARRELCEAFSINWMKHSIVGDPRNVNLPSPA